MTVPMAPVASGEPETVTAVADGAFLTERPAVLAFVTWTCWPTEKAVELAVNVAETVLADVTVQVPEVAVHTPPHPVKVEPDDGVAVRTTDVPELNEAEQVVPHDMPEGALAIEPEPVTEAETV